MRNFYKSSRIVFSFIFAGMGMAMDPPLQDADPEYSVYMQKLEKAISVPFIEALRKKAEALNEKIPSFSELQVIELDLPQSGIFHISGIKDSLLFSYILKTVNSSLIREEQCTDFMALDVAIRQSCLNDPDLPYLVAYKGWFSAEVPQAPQYKVSPLHTDLVISEKAKGKSINEYFNSFVTASPEEDYDDFILKHIENASRQIGKFHEHFGLILPDSSTFVTVVHGDLNSGNWFYDLETRRVSFIDYAQMIDSVENELGKKKDCKIDLQKLFSCSSYNFEIIEKNNKRKKRAMRFIQSLKKGYLSAFAHQDAIRELIEPAIVSYINGN